MRDSPQFLYCTVVQKINCYGTFLSFRYKDTLATIGALGREAPDHSLNILTRLLEGRLTRLHGQMQRLISQNNKCIDKVLSDLYEDIHWLLLITGEAKGDITF